MYDQTPIVILDRGECSFVKKTRNVQNLGGRIALIVNHGQDYKEIFGLSDDGSGNDIQISSILIPENEGQILKNFFEMNKNNPDKLKEVVLNIDNKFKKMPTIKIDLFFNPKDKKAYELLDEIEQIDKDFLLNDLVKFNPIYSFNSNLDGDQYLGYLKSRGRCMCGTKYCEDYDIIEGFGNNILVESIHQKCMYQLTHNTDDQNKYTYFKYMKSFHDLCYNDLAFSEKSPKCSENIIRNLDKDLYQKIYLCFLTSFRYHGQGDDTSNYSYKTLDDIYSKCGSNIYLEEHHYYLNRNSRKALPLLSINDNIYFGSWKAKNIIEAACSALYDPLQLAACRSYSEVADSQKPIRTYIFAIILSIIFISTLTYFICKRYITKKIAFKLEPKNIDETINIKVKEYFSFKSQTGLELPNKSPLNLSKNSSTN